MAILYNGSLYELSTKAPSPPPPLHKKPRKRGNKRGCTSNRIVINNSRPRAHFRCWSSYSCYLSVLDRQIVCRHTGKHIISIVNVAVVYIITVATSMSRQRCGRSRGRWSIQPLAPYDLVIQLIPFGVLQLVWWLRMVVVPPSDVCLTKFFRISKVSNFTKYLDDLVLHWTKSWFSSKSRSQSRSVQ